MRNPKLLMISSLVFLMAAVGNAAEPIRISVGQYEAILPSDSRAANVVIRVVYEHHKDNQKLDVACDGEMVAVASGRDIRGRDEEGIAEEFFPFSLPGGTYVCGAVLLRGGKLLPSRIAELPVVRKESK